MKRDMRYLGLAYAVGWREMENAMNEDQNLMAGAHSWCASCGSTDPARRLRDDCTDPWHGYAAERGVYMVMVSEASGCVFVKAHDFFRSQGGFKEAWGRRWRPVLADSVEDARRLGCEMFPEAKPYERQAKP